MLKTCYHSRASAKTECFIVEGVSVEQELIPLITSDIGVYGKRSWPIHVLFKAQESTTFLKNLKYKSDLKHGNY